MYGFRVLFILFLFLNHFGFADSLTQELAIQRSQRLSSIRYDLAFDFEKGKTSYSGTAILQFSDSQNDRDLPIDLLVDEVKAVKVAQVIIEDFQYSKQQGRLIIPAKHLKKGENRIEVEYTTSFSTNGSGFHRFVDPEDGTEYHFTDFQPYKAHHVFPCFDQPDLRAEFRLKITIPKTWTAMANGGLISNRYSGKGRELVFQPTPPISTYLFHITVGDFAEWTNYDGSIPMRILCRQSQEAYLDPDGIFAATQRSLTFFAEYFDTPYPFSKYDQAFVPEYNAGAMENVGAVVFNEALNLGYNMPKSLLTLRDSVIVHEVAHHWFGNLVNLKWWDDLWLNESFASYMELLGLEALGYEEPWTSVIGQKSGVYLSDSFSTTHPVVMPIKDTKQAEANFDDITYTKGMAVLRQLDFSLGKTIFRDALRDYFKTHAWQSTSITDFLNAMKRQAPNDLTPWINAWLHDKGVNRSRLEWQAKNGVIESAKMLQFPGSGSGALRKHATLLGFFKQDPKLGARLIKEIRIDYESSETPLPQLKGMPAPDFILPNWKEYDYVESELDAQSLAWLLENTPSLQSPQLRQQVWQMLMLLLRAGKLGVQPFLELALIDIKNQENGDHLRQVAEYTLETMRHYLPSSSQFGKVRSRYFEAAKGRLATDASGFQMRYLFFILLIESAHTEAELRFLYDWLKDKEHLEGWVLDEEDRMLLIQILMRNKYPKAPSLFKALKPEELSSDPSMLRLLASSPQKDAKQKAWQLIFEESPLSLENKRHLMEHFFVKGQTKTISPYIPQYFQQIERIYKTGAWPFARDLVEMMFPHAGENATLKASKKFLKKDQVPQVLKNLVAREKELLEMRMRIRKLNQKMAKLTGQ